MKITTIAAKLRKVAVDMEIMAAIDGDLDFPDGEIIFSVGKDTLTSDQILELLERGELDAEGVRRSVEAQAATPMRRQVASS